MKVNEKELLLYGVTDRHWLKGTTLAKQVEESLKGGVSFLQIREKDLPYEEFLKEARELKVLCKKYNVPFVINDNVKIAKEMDADGVHVGQSDMEMLEARKVLGEDKIIGVSVTTAEEAIIAQNHGADYLGAGSVFVTGSKDDAVNISHQELTKICKVARVPVIAIGGISADNIMELAGSGICGVALISAIYGQPDVEKAAMKMKKLARKMVEA